MVSSHDPVHPDMLILALQGEEVAPVLGARLHVATCHWCWRFLVRAGSVKQALLEEKVVPPTGIWVIIYSQTTGVRDAALWRDRSLEDGIAMVQEMTPGMSFDIYRRPSEHNLGETNFAWGVRPFPETNPKTVVILECGE